MMRLVLVAVLATACWSSAPDKTAEPGKPDPLLLELAASQQELSTLRHRLREVTDERDDAIAVRATLEAKIRQLEAATIAAPPPSPPRRREPDASKTYAIALGNWPQRGPADAKVTMVFVHDYACPYCEKARATLDDLRTKYGKDLRIVYRPIIIRPQQSTAGALAACAANRQKKYDKLEPLLWEKGFKARNFDTDVTAADGTTQRCWTAPGGCPIVLGFATEAGLDLARFKADMPPCEAVVHDSMTELAALGIAATPSFFINGRYMSGAQPIDKFSVLIDEEKQKADQRIRSGTPKARYYQDWVVGRGETSLTP